MGILHLPCIPTLSHCVLPRAVQAQHGPNEILKRDGGCGHCELRARIA